MLKIVTDPTVYPIRELDLAASAGHIAATQLSAAGGFRDLLYTRPDGGDNVFLRRRRTELTLSVDFFNSAMAALAEDLANTPGYGREKTPVYVAPPFDRSTLLSAPMLGSLQAWVADPGSGTLQKSPLTFVRASAAQYFNEVGDVETAGFGVPRYVPSNLGPGILLHQAPQNLLVTSHPTAGVFGWNTGSGATLAWDTYFRSPYRAAGGVLRFEVAAGAWGEIWRNDATGIGAGTGGYYRATVWCAGRGQVTLQARFGVGSYVSGERVTLRPDVYQPVTVRLEKTVADDTIGLNLVTPTLDYAQEVHVGPGMASAVNADPLTEVELDDWQDLGSRTVEDCYRSNFAFTPSYTVSVCGKLPPRGRGAYVWRLTSSTYLVFWSSGSQSTMAFKSGGLSTDTLLIPSAHHDANERGPFVAVARHKAGDPADPEHGLTLELTFGGVTYRTQKTADVSAAEGPGALALGAASSLYTSRRIAPQWLRVDGRAWSNAEMTRQAAMFDRGGLRQLITRTAGRKFIFQDVNLSPVDGVRDRHNGTLTLREISHDPDFTF